MDDGSFVKDGVLNPDVPVVVDDDAADAAAALLLWLLLGSNDPAGPNGPDVVMPPLDFVRSAGLSGNVSVLFFLTYHVEICMHKRSRLRQNNIEESMSPA